MWEGNIYRWQRFPQELTERLPSLIGLEFQDLLAPFSCLVTYPLIVLVVEFSRVKFLRPNLEPPFQNLITRLVYLVVQAIGLYRVGDKEICLGAVEGQRIPDR